MQKLTDFQAASKSFASTARPVLISRLLILVIHVVGIIGMALPVSQPYFQLLTPFHLLICLGILLAFHKDWSKQFLIFVVGAFLLGFGFEVLGVHTGFPFGNYIYGHVLGVQLAGVPLMIGVNWLLLVYLTGVLFLKITNDFLAAALASLTMVFMDVLIEPVAVALDFWSWAGNEIPLTNYLGWFGVAFLIQMVYRKLKFRKDNPLALLLLLSLVAFFAILNLII